MNLENMHYLCDNKIFHRREIGTEAVVLDFYFKHKKDLDSKLNFSLYSFQFKLQSGIFITFAASNIFKYKTETKHSLSIPKDL